MSERGAGNGAGELGLLDESAEELYEHAPCGYLSCRPDGRIVRVNQTFLDWTGYARGALLSGMRLPDLLAGPGRIFYETHFDPLLRMQGEVREVAFDLRRADGSILPILLNAGLRRDADGRPTVVRSTVFDATDRRRYEHELLVARRRAELLADVVRASGDAILVLSPGGRVEAWNPGAERLFGYPAAEALGRPIQELIVPADRAEEFARDFALALTGVEIRTETVRRRKDGGALDVSLSLTPHTEPVDEIVAVSSIIRDVTERRRLEERLRWAEHLQALGTLAGGVAHEVNNQITAVLGFGAFVLKALGPHHPQAPDVQRILDAGERSARIAQQLLAFGRRQLLAPVLTDLHALVADLLPVLQRLLGADKTVVLAPRKARGRVRVDRTQMEQVLINLTLNARDAMDTNGRLTIGIGDVELGAEAVGRPIAEAVAPGPYVRLAVVDTGRGMAREVVARIFEPFFTTKPVGEGTGLGLPTVYGIVRQHGGHLRVESEPGRGTTVTIYLPAFPGGAEARPEDDGLAGRPAEESGTAPPKAASVLVVEDDVTLRELARRSLEGAGLVVHEAANGHLALAALRRGEFAAVVTDLVMPEMNGRQLGAAVAAGWPRVAVLYTSAYSAAEMRARGMLPDGAAFLQKPFVPDELAARVTALLGRS